MAENIYNIAVIVDYFVSNQPEIEELYNLAPVIKNLRDNADLLNAFLLILREIKINSSISFQTLFKKCSTGLLRIV